MIPKDLKIYISSQRYAGCFTYTINFQSIYLSKRFNVINFRAHFSTFRGEFIINL